MRCNWEPNRSDEDQDMPREVQSAMHMREEARANCNRAERTWRKIHNAWCRLYRERYETKGELTEAEREAERACEVAGAALAAAREYWRYVQCTVPKPRSVKACSKSDFDSDQ
jgi:hypothetical protein